MSLQGDYSAEDRVSCPLMMGSDPTQFTGRVFMDAQLPGLQFVVREPIDSLSQLRRYAGKAGRGKGQCTKCSHVIDLEDE